MCVKAKRRVVRTVKDEQRQKKDDDSEEVKDAP
jgi:hypothetical protein